MKKRILICLMMLLSLCLVFGMVACSENAGTTDTQGDTNAVTEGITNGETDAQPVDTTETPVDTSADTTDASAETSADTSDNASDETSVDTEAETEEPPYVLDFNALPADQLKGLFTNASQTTVDVATDDDGEQYVVLTTSVDNASDPFVAFNVANFIKKAELKTMRDVKKYEYLLLKVRQVGCSSGSFDLYYWAGSTGGATPGMNIMEGFDVSDDDWQYILFDMSNATGWEGKPNGFRFDYMMSAVAKGETFHIAEVQFLVTADSYYQSFDLDLNDKGVAIKDEAKERVEELMSSVKTPDTAFDDYTKENATDEDASLKMWFDHMYTRAPQSGATPTDKITYQIQLAKNETEGCQFVLSPENNVTGLKVYLTDFKNANGDTLKTDLHWGYYFKVDGEYVIDPLPPVTYEKNQAMIDWCNGGNAGGQQIDNLQKYDGFDIKGGESQSFVIKATTTADTAPGEYTATVTVMSADGKQVKKATVFVYVWNFTLADESDCKTLMDLGSFDIYATYYDYAAALRNDKDQNLYEAYYNFMLDYRVNCYTLPTESKNGNYSGSASYLNNPRVQAFLALGWKTAGQLMSEDPSGSKFGDTAANAYESLSQNPDWLDKAYFYPVDEPGSNAALDSINQYGEILMEKFPNYKLIAPMHVNYATAKGDYFSYVTGAVNVWCPKTFFFNTFGDWYADRTLEYGSTPALEEKLDSLRDRFWAEQAEGDEVWWYVTRRPNNPEITLIINTDAVNIRTLFWQQKLYGVDGFLYYSINHWGNTEGRNGWIEPDEYKYYHGLSEMYEIAPEYPNGVYGSGILIYCGVYFAQTDPVASLRLESVRDGIEDYEYFSMLEKAYGKDVVNAFIAQWTTSLGQYSTDVEAFRALRSALGALVEQAVNQAE